MTTNKFYNEIDKALYTYENFKPYHAKSIEWISDRISWCWKWKKISEDQMEELCERVINILERN